MDRPRINFDKDDDDRKDEFQEEKEIAVIELLRAIDSYVLQSYPLVKDRAERLKRLYGLAE